MRQKSPTRLSRQGIFIALFNAVLKELSRSFTFQKSPFASKRYKIFSHTHKFSMVLYCLSAFYPCLLSEPFSLFLSIIHSITIPLETTHEYNLYFHLSDGLKTSGTHQHHCRLSSLRRQQHFFQPRRTRTATTKSPPAIP